MQEENSSSAERLVECKVCSKSMKAITNSHLKTHGMTTSEYRVKFPHAAFGEFSRFADWRNSEENKAHMREQNKRIFSSHEIREKRKTNLFKAMKTEEYKQALSAAMKVYAQTPLGKQRLSNKPVTARMKLSNFERWVDQFGLDEAVRRQLDWQAKNVLPAKSRHTKPELMLADMLRLMNVKFIDQFPLPRMYCDFFLPDYNMIVEVDGDYWHANPSLFAPTDLIGKKKTMAQEIWARDAERTNKIQSLGYKVMRIWSSDLKKTTAQQLVEDIVRHCEKLQ